MAGSKPTGSRLSTAAFFVGLAIMLIGAVLLLTLGFGRRSTTVTGTLTPTTEASATLPAPTAAAQPTPASGDLEADPEPSATTPPEPEPSATSLPEPEPSTDTTAQSPTPAPAAEPDQPGATDTQPTAQPDTNEGRPAGGSAVFDGPVIARYGIRPPEPSGASWSAVRNGLWVVSDDSTAAWLIDDQGTEQGIVILDTDHRDWEGIAELPDGRLVVATEPERRLLVIDPQREELIAAVAIEDLTDDQQLVELLRSGDDNKGLEGVAVAADGAVWAAKEAQPILLLELEPDLSAVRRWIDPTAALSAASGIAADDIDVAGLTIDPARPGVLWIASDEASAVFAWDIATGTVSSMATIDTPQLEGIAISDQGRAFAVDDRAGELLLLDPG